VLPRQFASQKALLDYAEQKGLVYVWAYTQREQVLSPAFIAREHLLSPDQYELVDVRTRSGVRRAMLFPKAILMRRGIWMRHFATRWRSSALARRKRSHLQIELDKCRKREQVMPCTAGANPPTLAARRRSEPWQFPAPAGALF
jgi:hypothetical protein